MVPGPNHGAIKPQKWRVAFSVWPFYEDMMRPLSNLPDIWGEGAIFAFSGLEGEFHSRLPLDGGAGGELAAR